MDTLVCKIDKEREELLRLYESQLPHGYKTVIANRLGMCRMTVSKFFSNKNKNLQIENEVLKVITELRQERNQKLINTGLL